MCVDNDQSIAQTNRVTQHNIVEDCSFFFHVLSAGGGGWFDGRSCYDVHGMCNIVVSQQIEI